MRIIKKLLISVILVIIIIGLVAGLILGVPGYNMYKEAIEATPIDEKIASIKEEKKSYTKYEDLPEIYVKAVIAAEDRRFYEHKGIDFIGIARAIYNDIRKQSLVEGGSTITQQLAKNIYFTQERTSKRKIAEIFMAAEIEKNCEKNEILELYANTSYFGDGYYTVKDACKGYFKKELNEMTDYECIMLAGLPNAPSIYAPTKNPELAKQRTKHVINKMVEYGYLNQQEANKLLEK